MIIDERLQKEAVQEICRKKFHGHDILISKYTPVFPASIEREYGRISRQYMRLLKESIEDEIPALKERIMMERGTYRADGINDVMELLEKVLDKIQKRFTEKTQGYGLRRKLESLANMTRKLTIREWKKAVDKTLGINIIEDYYMGEFFQTAIDRWVDENVLLIKTIPSDTLGDMRTIVKEGFLNGKSTTSIMKEIQHKYNVEKSHARLLARDQIGKLNASINEAQQRDAGIEEYIWDDCGDGRVRGIPQGAQRKKIPLGYAACCGYKDWTKMPSRPGLSMPLQGKTGVQVRRFQRADIEKGIGEIQDVGFCAES